MRSGSRLDAAPASRPVGDSNRATLQTRIAAFSVNTGTPVGSPGPAADHSAPDGPCCTGSLISVKSSTRVKASRCSSVKTTSPSSIAHTAAQRSPRRSPRCRSIRRPSGVSTTAVAAASRVPMSGPRSPRTSWRRTPRGDLAAGPRGKAVLCPAQDPSGRDPAVRPGWEGRGYGGFRRHRHGRVGQVAAGHRTEIGLARRAGLIALRAACEKPHEDEDGRRQPPPSQTAPPPRPLSCCLITCRVQSPARCTG